MKKLPKNFRKVNKRCFYVFCPICKEIVLYRRLISHNNSKHLKYSVGHLYKTLHVLLETEPEKWVANIATKKGPLNDAVRKSRIYIDSINENYKKFIFKATQVEIENHPPNQNRRGECHQLFLKLTNRFLINQRKEQL
ncbi:hypothetical protein SAMN05192566_1445 [Methylophilus rhizosphaerae]|uniref:Uncharacterized protein n=1 Tax=Methylophilus rhizosphaerae TaxID=492660 RepID=A0A1G9CGG7_9PROT|nr:hypothetical protein SAMN05192566_1445 [Methylophilus rhizosphaerae]